MRRSVQSRRRMACALLAAISLGTSAVSAQDVRDFGDPDLAAGIAEDLVRSAGGPAALQGRHLGVRPVDIGGLPLPAQILDRLNAVVAADLGRLAGQGLRVATADGIARAAQDIFRHRPDDSDRLLRDLLAAKDYDLLLLGRVHWDSPHVYEVNYSLVERVTGETRATASPRRFRVTEELVGAGEVFDVDAALRSLAQDLVDKVALGRLLYLQPFGIGDTGAPQRVGGWLAQRLAEDVREARAKNGAVTGAPLLTEAMPRLAGRDWQSERPELGPVQHLLSEQGGLLLNGRLWPDGQVVDVRIELRGPEGILYEGSSRISLASLPGWARQDLRAPAGHGRQARRWSEHLPGPHGLRIFADRDPVPVYPVGDELHFDVVLDRDAHLNCFALDLRQGELVRLFPNEVVQDSRVRGGGIFRMPDDIKRADGWGFRWPAEPPPGEVLVKCFATDRAMDDAVARLAASSAGLRPEPLLELFRIEAGTPVSEAGLQVWVAGKAGR